MSFASFGSSFPEFLGRSAAPPRARARFGEHEMVFAAMVAGLAGASAVVVHALHAAFAF